MNQKLKEFKKQYKNKKVVVMGLGLNGGGVGSAKFFAKLGANVLITDLKTKQDLSKSIKKLDKFGNIDYVLGEHRESDFKNADLIIKNPGVRNTSKFLKIAVDNNIKINTDIGIFFELCENKIIGVTGSKGKSTTTKLIVELLQTQYNVVTGGNNRISVLSILEKLKQDELVVLELSSWQLEILDTVKKSPQISVITNIEEDHLDTYENSVQKYADAKFEIVKHQTKEDVSIMNKSSSNLKKCIIDSHKINSKTIFFGKEKTNDVFVDHDKNKFIFKKEEIDDISNFKLLGEHNLMNALPAISVAKILEIKPLNIKKVLKSFKAPEGRIEIIREYKGIKMINDTTATSPIGATQALNSIKEPIVLIAGGKDKDLDYSDFVKLALQKVKYFVLFNGTATDKILELFKNNKISNNKYCFVETMKDAVRIAYNKCSKGDALLLSPAAASFPTFKNEFDRGDQFIKNIKKIK